MRKSSSALTMQPTSGAAMRFITSAPVPELTITGINPATITDTVIIFGRMRSSAP